MQIVQLGVQPEFDGLLGRALTTRGWDHCGMVEQVSGRHQANAGASRGPHPPDVDQWRWGKGPLPSSQALREPGRGPSPDQSLPPQTATSGQQALIT